MPWCGGDPPLIEAIPGHAVDAGADNGPGARTSSRAWAQAAVDKRLLPGLATGATGQVAGRRGCGRRVQLTILVGAKGLIGGVHEFLLA